MIEIKNKQDCCGCGGCMNVCPKGCITMKEDNEGFLYPEVNKDQCVQCGLCEKVCPVINFTPKDNNPDQKAFIVQHKDREILRQSTSGGAFTAIAQYIIEQGGVVVGVGMDESHKISHIFADSQQDLEKFRNSKYVQSDTGITYRQTKQYLDKGRLVCYSGTPCQIEGLIHYLRKDYENLILVDVVCRAVPSPGIWRKYCEAETKKHGPLTEIRFRDKAWGYQYPTMLIKCSDGNSFRGGVESQTWLRMFFSGMIIRPSCSSCKFRGQYRNSDFTLWDCYNIHNIDRSFDEAVGTTRMLIHSQKGERLFNKIKDSYKYRHIEVSAAVNGVVEMQSSPEMLPNRTAFFECVNQYSLEKALDKFYPNTIKVRTRKHIKKFLYKTGLYSFTKRMVYRIVKRRKYK